MESKVRVTVVGSADAFNSSGRSHSSYLLEGPGTSPVMVDFGATSLAALRRLGREPNELAGVVVTHLHGDHVGGFPFLLIDALFSSMRTRPLTVVGPVGLGKKIEELFQLFYGRVAEVTRPFDYSVQEIVPGDEINFAGLKVRAFAAEHMDLPDRPLCLRFGAGGRTVSFSGDTEMCPGLRDAAAGADLLIAECTAMKPPAGRHCTWEDWKGALPGIGSRRVVLTHLGSDVRRCAVELSRTVGPGVDLAFADDGLVLDV